MSRKWKWFVALSLLSGLVCPLDWLYMQWRGVSFFAPIYSLFALIPSWVGPASIATLIGCYCYVAWQAVQERQSAQQGRCKWLTWKEITK